MTDVFFQLSSDFMAISPAGETRWSRVNPALAERLRLSDAENGPFNFADPHDPSRIVMTDGSLLVVDWTVREEGSFAYWVGRERASHVMRELHHRLKNNLQMVVSLLGFQASRLSAPEMQEEFANAESRVRAVARLHEPAYASSDFSHVEFGQYLHQLVQSLAADDASVITLKAAEVALPMKQAVPLALIANELIRNAVEYSPSETVDVQLRYEPGDMLSLTVSGGGTGLDLAEAGHALELVHLFVDQLQGSLQTQAPTPDDVSVTFPLSDD